MTRAGETGGMRLTRPSLAQAIVFWCIVATLVVVTVLVPAVARFDAPRAQVPGAAETVEGRVTEVLERTSIETSRGTIEQERLAIEVAGTTATVSRSRSTEDIGTLHVEPGDRVLVARVPGPEGDAYLIVDRVRSQALLVLAVAFVAMVLVTGRRHGLTSLLGLAASLLVIVRFIVPGILAGYDPAVIASIGAFVIMGTTLYLAHGVSVKTTVALIGTGVALVATVLLAALSIRMARISGIASEDVATLQVLAAGHVDAAGVLLGGFVIGTLGVLDDITVAQASAVFELRRANAALGAIELYRRAMNVGRDHIAATVNTLVLAYAGASLPLLMLLVVQGEALSMQINREYLATEVMRSLVGGMGLIAAVPLTTAIAALVAHRAVEAPTA